jgi:nucleoside-diphosphate-sugar epimerase
MPQLKRVLVTGGAGYVGSRLIPQLLEQDYSVNVIDWFLYHPNVFHAYRHNPNMMLIKGDIRDADIVKRGLENVDAVIHLAAISNDPSSNLNPQLTEEINLHAVRQLVQIAKEQGVQRFINASSASVYGIKDTADVTEDISLDPITVYARCKVESERIILGANDAQFTAVSLRPATLCGVAPRLRLDLTVNILTYHALHYGKITVFGGEQKRPNLHIQDMINAYLLMLRVGSSQIAGEAFNVSHENHSMMRIAEIVRETLGGDTEIEIVPTQDTRSYHLSAEKIKRVIGFEPELSIIDAIQEIRTLYESKKLHDPEATIYHNVRLMKELQIQ